MNSDSMLKASILLILCTFFWGSCYPISKAALHEMNALTLVFWRFLIASACLFIYMKVVRLSFPHLSLSKWSWVILISALGVGGFNIIVFTGLSYTSPTNGSLIMALSPLMTSLIACIALRTWPPKAQCISLLISFIGVLMVITNGHIDTLLSTKINHGDRLILCGMLAWSIYTYFSQGISRWMPVIPYTLVGMLSGTALIGVMCLISPDVHPFIELRSSTDTGLIEVLYIAVFGTVAGYLLWLNGVRRLGSANASVFFNFVPVFSVLTSYVFGQPSTRIQLVGIVIVILGLLLPRVVSLLKRESEICSES